MRSAYESNETLTALHDLHGGYYDYGDLNTRSKTLEDFQRGLALLEKEFRSRSPHRLLDVGFGNGLFLALAKQRGWQVQGLDPSPKNVELARNKFSLELKCGSLESYEDEVLSYDAISFWDVLEHLSDPHLTLRKAADLLKPDGLILIGLPNDQSFLALVSAWLYRLSGGKIKKGVETIYLLEHVAYYNPKTLTLLLEKNGFERRGFFLTRTDLARYTLPIWDKFLAGCLLGAGKLTGLENRLAAVFRKQSTL